MTGAPGVVVVVSVVKDIDVAGETRLLRSSVASDGDEATTDGWTWRRNRPSEKNPSVQNVETETGENRTVLEGTGNLKNPEKDISNISMEKTTTKMRQTGCL